MSQLTHRLGRMTGRDPHEGHRVATPLELLFDLAFVVAFGAAAAELAHGIGADHALAAVGAFAFCVFAISWAWINFSWFASAYDTDDWVYRLTTMVQMAGVVLLTLGIPAVFVSIEEGERLDNGVLVLGYVIMRVAMVAQWLRAGREDPTRRSARRTYVVAILIAQVGWVALALAPLSIAAAFAVAPFLYAVELTGPYLAERRWGGTPLARPPHRRTVRPHGHHRAG